MGNRLQKADSVTGTEKLSGHGLLALESLRVLHPKKTGMLQDGQPSTRQLLSSSQAIVSSYLNDAYGNNISSSGSAANSFKWNGGSGYYSDAESGLQKVGARYYDPSVGSWISQDTILIAGSPADSQAVNRYLYCSANPVGRVDPSGRLFGIDDAVFTVGALIIILIVWEGATHYGAGKAEDETKRIGNSYADQVKREMHKKDEVERQSWSNRQRQSYIQNEGFYYRQQHMNGGQQYNR